MIKDVLYRPGQVLSVLAARRTPPDLSPARQVLPAELMSLFESMPPEDQRHGLRVMSDLQARGESGLALLQAGLLHDLGKAGAGVGLPHRIMRVLLRKPLPRVWAMMTSRPTGWQRPFWVVANHPERGAVWVHSAGGSDALVDLIRYHESKIPAAWAGTALEKQHAALAWADARS